MFWYCDGKVDCIEGSDEANCACSKFHMEDCTLSTGVVLCLPQNWVCSMTFCLEVQVDKCTEKEDSVAPTCSPSSFFCHINQTCVNSEKLCDGVVDCIGEEDEAGCGGESNQRAVVFLLL